MEIDIKTMKIIQKKYFYLKDLIDEKIYKKNLKISYQEVLKQFDVLLNKSIKKRLVSDAPI
jgi:hypothetical protein